MCRTQASLVAFICAIFFGRIADTATVTNASVRGPLPDTATKGVLVWNLSEAGYVAEEYLVSGTADVYEPAAMADAGNMLTRNNVADMAQRDFSLKTVKTAQPYTTRILVYRPADPKRFSGNVIVETLHPSGGGRSVVWDMLNSFFIGHGDAYIGVQHPSTFAGVKAAAPGRYDDLSMVDNTQLWSSIAQVGRVAKEGSKQSPLNGYAVRRLYLTGYSFTGVAAATFANWHHASAVLANGQPIFDGYVSNANSMYNRPIAAPVMRMNTQSDFDSFGGINNRRDDSDAKSSRYRLYEVSGAAHVTRPVTPAAGAKRPQPPPGGVASANQPRFSPEACTNAFPTGSVGNSFPLHLMVAAMFENMYRWVDEGVAPPRAPRIEVGKDGKSLKDADGNAKGGLRLPALTAPIATYDVGHGDDCFLFGYQLPYAADKRKSLYGSKVSYVDAVKKASERLVKDHWLLPSAVTELTSVASGEEF